MNEKVVRGDYVIVTTGILNDVCAKVLEVVENDDIVVELTRFLNNSTSALYTSRARLKKDEYRRAEVKMYDVTVARLGHVPVIATCENQAMRMADRCITNGRVEWLDDWQATDVQESHNELWQ